jgi:hypothetical protein
MPDNTQNLEPVVALRFAEYVENGNLMPNARIVRMIDEKTFPFAENRFFSYNPALLASDEFNRCARIYTERAAGQGPMEAMQLMQELMTIEAPHREELVNIAIEIVREMYNVPESINLRAFLENSNDEAGEEFDDSDVEVEMISDERKEQLKPEIEKRRILNSIVHGAAIHQWTSAYYIASDKLSDINPQLLEKYNRLSALVNYFNWQIVQSDMMQMGGRPVLQGYNKVDIEKKEIKASAMNFPVLIHELSKGVVDYLVSAGIPELPPYELEYVYAEADKYSHEQWHYFFGPTLWRALLKNSDVTSHDLPPVINYISQLDYIDLSNLCIDICHHPDELGKKQMESIQKSINKPDESESTSED